MRKELINRYTRQSILEEIGEEGQKELKKSAITIVGCGGLGCIMAQHLTRAGIGKITIVDRDIVELENLQRQILFDEQDIGAPKATAAVEKLKKINSELEYKAFVNDLNPNNAEKILDNINIVLDGTDNMETRYLINDVCVKKKIPWVYGGVVSTYGMSMNILPEITACLVCAFPQMPKAGSLPTCDTVGILNTVPSIIGSIQVTEAIKILLKKKFSRGLIVYDVWSHDFQCITLRRNNDCTCCKDHNFEYLSEERTESTTILCGSNSIQITPGRETELSLQDLAERLKKVGDVKLSSIYLVFKTKDVIIHVFKDGRAIVKGTENVPMAKSIYAKYVGN
jgi:molybdopterin/thiamine biosynthesis adenylyltransferase